MATKTVIANTNIIFGDIPTNMDIHPKRKDLLTLKNENAVKRSIRNLILTDSYERPFQPEIGGNIKGMLFENLSTLTLSQIENKIESVISNFEPRARVLSVIANSRIDDNAVTVSILFSIIGNSKPLEVNILLERQR